MTTFRLLTDAHGGDWTIFEANPHDGDSSVQGRTDPAAVRWLCFRSDTEVRRIRPVPTDWQRLDDATLRIMLDEAGPTGKRPRAPRPSPILPASSDDAYIARGQPERRGTRLERSFVIPTSSRKHSGAGDVGQAHPLPRWPHGPSTAR